MTELSDLAGELTVTIVPYTLTKYQGKSSTLEIINQYFLLKTTEKN